MKFKFQSFYDVSTSASSMQVLQFSVGGKEVLDRCRHLFGAYKYFKLGKLSIKMCPASTLPVDPLQLSYDTSDPQSVDPRDQMNPGLVRITNGEDVFTNVSALNATEQERVYTSMMLDPRWSKFMLQSGFRRTAYPLYWQIGQLHQDKFPGAVTNVPHEVGVSGGHTEVDGVVAQFDYVTGTSLGSAGTALGFSSAHGLFQVGHKGRLGFLPTDYYQEFFDGTAEYPVGYGINNIPTIQVITCVLPKAFKTLYFYRIYCTQEVIFTGLRAGPPVVTSAGVHGYSTVGLDQFVVGTPTPIKPGGIVAVPTAINNNGGNLP
nr:MAG: capsid protein [Virus sp.]